MVVRFSWSTGCEMSRMEASSGDSYGEAGGLTDDRIFIPNRIVW